MAPAYQIWRRMTIPGVFFFFHVAWSSPPISLSFPCGGQGAHVDLLSEADEISVSAAAVLPGNGIQ